MATIQLKKDERLSFKVSHQMAQSSKRRVDVYFSFPKDLDVSPKSLPESHYFNTGISSKQTYYSSGLHLPLLHTRFASLNNKHKQYRDNLHLFAYHYDAALSIDVREALALEEPIACYNAALELVEQSLALMKKFRRSPPTTEPQIGQFNNVDNYISWQTVQEFLRFLNKAPRSSDIADIRAEIFSHLNTEEHYRQDKRYPSSLSQEDDPHRLANKMRLIKRLIEHDVLFKQKQVELGIVLKKAATGVASALIAIVVLSLILVTRDELNNLTSVMILVLAAIYGMREVFKDDLKNALWRFVLKGRPKWASFLYQNNRAPLIKQRIWLDYIKRKKAPEEVRQIIRSSHKRNKQNPQMLHFRIDSLVSEQRFLPGYSAVQEIIYFNLVQFIRYISGDGGVLYQENGGKISRVAIEKRFQINVIVGISDKGRNEQPAYKRYKINLTRSKILSIVAVNNKPK